MSKRGGIDGVFQRVAGLLQGDFLRAHHEGNPKLFMVRPILDIRFPYNPTSGGIIQDFLYTPTVGGNIWYPSYLANTPVSDRMVTIPFNQIPFQYTALSLQ